MAGDAMDETQEHAEFVFRGTVEKVGASAMAEVKHSDRTAVVVVDEVVHAPEQFANLQGDKVTLLLAQPNSVKEGEQWVFFTTGWLFGATLALRELEHRPVEDADEHRAALTAAVESRDTARIQQRIEAADVVIAGRVTAVRPPEQTAAAALSPTEPSGPVTEHDPQWWEAVVDVYDVLKGDAAAEPTVVLFPGSTDVMWHDAPKFRPGQEGVWFLHGERVPAAAAQLFPQVYTVLDKADFQHNDRLDEVRRLVGEGES